MKKLRRISIAPSDRMLDAKSMIDIAGGQTARLTSCSTTCGSNKGIAITNCNGNCISKDGHYVACLGPTTELWKYCG